MLLNTLEALYQGKKHLFKDLYVYDKWEWKEYPVIFLGFSGMIYSSTKEAFEENIAFKLNQVAKIYKVRTVNKHYKGILSELLLKLFQKIGEKVVVLVDY